MREREKGINLEIFVQSTKTAIIFQRALEMNPNRVSWSPCGTCSDGLLKALAQSISAVFRVCCLGLTDDSMT